MAIYLDDAVANVMGNGAKQELDELRRQRDALAQALSWLADEFPKPECYDEEKALENANKLIANLDSEPAERWIPCSERLPDGIPVVIGFNPDWIDDDFNPKGVRECALYGDGTEWMTARWCDLHDQWHTTYEHEAEPTHWMEYPEPPQGGRE